MKEQERERDSERGGDQERERAKDPLAAVPANGVAGSDHGR